MKSFFQCSSGKYSFSRLIAAVCILFAAVLPMSLWALLSIIAKDGPHLQELPSSVIGYATSILGPVLLYLYGSKREETKANNEKSQASQSPQG